jgi:hypothetical protein
VITNIGFCRPLTWGALCLLAITSAGAKIAKVSLDELIRESDVVVYGRVVKHSVTPTDKSNSIAWIKPIAILENKSGLSTGADIAICNYSDTESVDLNAHPGKYVVFAKQGDHCYAPIAGLKSVVLIQGDMALTGFIDGQPDKMKAREFLHKIRTLVSHDTP